MVCWFVRGRGCGCGEGRSTEKGTRMRHTRRGRDKKQAGGAKPIRFQRSDSIPEIGSKFELGDGRRLGKGEHEHEQEHEEGGQGKRKRMGEDEGKSKRGDGSEYGRAI